MALIDALAFAWVSVLVIVLILFTNDFLNNAQVAASAWQPWVTALGIIGASFFAVWQQNKVAGREFEQRQRKHYAARAALPTTLSEICDYAAKCAQEIHARRVLLSKGLHTSAPLNLPGFPVDQLRKVQECIESADEGPRERLAELLSALQVQHSRLKMVSSPQYGLGLYNFDQFLLDSINIYARSEMLFPYARRETNNDPGVPNKKEMIRVGRIIKVLNDQRFVDLIDRQYH